MKNWYQNITNNYPFLKFLGNRYTLVMIFFAIWMLFLDNQSLWDQRSLNKQIDELEDNKTYYKEEIAKDEKSIKSLKNPGETERYAREKYYMKKDSEDIYIIDIEDDKIKDSIAKAKQ
jgi:cell division protein FtsB